MKRRKFEIILVGLVLAILAAWLLGGAGRGTVEEQRFRQMRRVMAWDLRLRSAEKGLPSPLARLLHVRNLQLNYMRKGQAQQKALLASGYLTTTTITVTNLSSTDTNEMSCRVELVSRLQAAARAHFLLGFLPQTNQVLIICRSMDLALVRRAIESP
jgi:hypothetical protein